MTHLKPSLKPDMFLPGEELKERPWALSHWPQSLHGYSLRFTLEYLCCMLGLRLSGQSVCPACVGPWVQASVLQNQG